MRACMCVCARAGACEFQRIWSRFGCYLCSVYQRNAVGAALLLLAVCLYEWVSARRRLSLKDTMNKIRAYTFNSAGSLLLLFVTLFEQQETFFSAIPHGIQKCTLYICAHKFAFALFLNWISLNTMRKEKQKSALNLGAKNTRPIVTLLLLVLLLVCLFASLSPFNKQTLALTHTHVHLIH